MCKNGGFYGENKLQQSALRMADVWNNNHDVFVARSCVSGNDDFPVRYGR